MSGLKGSVLGFIAAWAGLDKVIAKLQKLTESLKAIQAQQKNIHEGNRAILEIGQAWETQTGTVGKQGAWAKTAVEVAAAGGLKSLADVEAMGIGMDIAHGTTGGIRNPKNQKLAKELAPMFGAAQLSGKEISMFFELASTMGVEQTKEGYQQAFAQVMGGYRASRASNFGTYVTGLLSGGGAYMAMGGDPKKAISLYSAARAVTTSENLAATLLEQATRISSGAYEEPRKALEKFAGAKWENLNMDQRMDVLLQYAHSIPESERTKRLAAEGFPAEMAQALTKMVSPVGIDALEESTQKVSTASRKNVVGQGRAYLESPLGKARKTQWEYAVRKLDAGGKFNAWQHRLQEAKEELDIRVATGKDDVLINNEDEKYFIAYQKMLDDINREIKRLEGADTPEAKKLLRQAYRDRLRIVTHRDAFGRQGVFGLDYTQDLSQGHAMQQGAELSERLLEDVVIKCFGELPITILFFTILPKNISPYITSGYQFYW